MPLDKVVREIEKRGEEKVEGIMGEAESEAKEILDRARSKRRSILEEAEEEADKAIGRMKEQEISRVNLENKRAHLKMERRMLDETIERARKSVARLPEDRDREIMARLISRNRDKGSVIYSASRHETMVRSEASGLEYGGNVDCLGGIVVEQSDGSVRHDLRYETLLSGAAESCIRDIARILFQSRGTDPGEEKPGPGSEEGETEQE